jgi:hypothetical protein
VNGSLIINGLSANNAVTPSIDNGFTVLDTVTTAGGQHWGGCAAYLIQATAAAINPTWTFSNTSVALRTASFKPA